MKQIISFPFIRYRGLIQTGSLTFFALSLFLYSCKGKDSSSATAPGPEIKDYAVLSLSPRRALVNFDFPATIQGQRIIEIRPRIDGYVDAVYVKEGAQVKKGQLLFRISNPQYEQDVITATASIQSAIANVESAKMEVEKVKPLVEKDIVSKYELSSAQYTLNAREAALAQAKAALTNAKTNIGYTRLQSPQDGFIGSLPYKVGALVNSSNPEPLTTLSDIANVYAYYSLNEKQLLDFFTATPGKTIQEKINRFAPAVLILADGSIYPEKGKVETASGLIATETGTVAFKASYPNPLGIIRSGASATVRIPRTVDSALVIPQSATYELQDKRFVYTVTGDNKVSGVAITVTPTDDGKFFIVNSGLSTGTTIVLEGLIGLTDGIQIIPKNVNADSVYNKAH